MLSSILFRKQDEFKCVESAPYNLRPHLPDGTAVNTRLQNLKHGRGDGEWHWMHFMFINVAMDLPILVVIHGFLARYFYISKT